MMRRGFVLLSAVFALGLLSSSSLAQAPDTLWTRTFEGIHPNKLLDIGAGEYVFTGNVIYGSEGSGTADSSKLALLWVNDAGDSLGSITIDGPERFQECYESKRMTNGDILMQGWGYSLVADSFEYHVTTSRVDAAGSLIWARPDVVDANDMLATPDGGALMIGAGGNAGLSDAAIKKIDVDGEVQWSRTYGNEPRAEVGKSIAQTSDGGYLLMGNWYEESAFEQGGYVVRLNAEFDTTWTRYFAPVSEVDVWDLSSETGGGGFLIYGRDGFTSGTFWIYAISADGDSLTGHIFDGIDHGNYASDVVRAMGGGVTIAGTANNYGDPWFARLDESGSILWERCCWADQTGFDYSRLTSLFQLSDGGYLLGGNRLGIGSWLIRTEPDPLDASNDRPELAVKIKLHQNYPNPFNPWTTIQFDLAQTADVRLAVYDITGRLVEELVSGDLSAGEHAVVWNAESVASGIYFYRLQAGEFADAKKMAVMK